MNNKICPSCGKAMKRNGRTSAGTQRWRCGGLRLLRGPFLRFRPRGLQRLHRLASFQGFPALHARRGEDLQAPIGALLRVWPMPDVVDEVHRVVFVDGIYLDRGLCVLIACTEEHVLSRYLARGETAAAWRGCCAPSPRRRWWLTDGGSGFASRRRPNGPPPGERCTYHAFCQVKRCTTTRPRLLAGVELYGLAKDLLA